MAFSDDIARLAEQITRRVEHVNGEEATKQALILPFFTALGYDIYDPTEVRPEYIADFAIKKAGQFEKVDYAVCKDGAIVMFVEAKDKGERPEAHDGQLQRYFNATPSAKVAVVTNGTEYRFFCDLREPNIMDREAFFSFNLLSHDAKDLEALKPFHKTNFDPARIVAHAEEMVYLKAMTRIVGGLLRSPSEAFVRFLVGELDLGGRVTSRVVEKFEPITKKAIQISLVDLMTRSISQEISPPHEVAAPTAAEPDEAAAEGVPDDTPGVITTEEELDGFERVKAIAARSSVKRELRYKDVGGYFSVHLGKITWWFVRFFFNYQKAKYIVTRLSAEEVAPLAPGFQVEPLTGYLGGSRVAIKSVADLDSLASLILRCYEDEASKH